VNLRKLPTTYYLLNYLKSLPPPFPMATIISRVVGFFSQRADPY